MWSRERLSVCAYFAILGAVCSAWASSLDELKVMLGLNDAQMGWLLFSAPCGNLISFLGTGPLVGRWGVRRSVRRIGTLYLLSAASLTVCFFLKCPVPVWCAVLVCYGAFGNMVNIGMNTQAGFVEKRAGRSIMGSFHGIFSLMMFGGAVFTMLTTSFRIPEAERLAVTVMVATVLHIVACAGLPPDEGAKSKGGSAVAVRHRPDRELVILGLAALVIMGCEASICDWVCIFFRELLHSSDASAKWGFCAVTGAMALARFAGDGFVRRFSPGRVLRADSMMVFLGMTFALSVPFIPVEGLTALLLALAGYAVAGFGIAGMIPILYSRVNRTKAMPPASALTFVGAMGFLGYFAGPPLIGHMAEVTNLSLALGVFAVLILALVFLRNDDNV